MSDLHRRPRFPQIPLKTPPTPWRRPNPSSGHSPRAAPAGPTRGRCLSCFTLCGFSGHQGLLLQGSWGLETARRGAKPHCPFLPLPPGPALGVAGPQPRRGTCFQHPGSFKWDKTPNLECEGQRAESVFPPCAQGSRRKRRSWALTVLHKWKLLTSFTKVIL